MVPKHYFVQAAVGGDLKSAEPYWDNDDYVGQIKLDGARYILHHDPDGTVRIYSRQISKKTGLPVDKTQQLIHLAKEFRKISSPGTVIDGEVAAPGRISSSNLVTRITGSKPDRAHELQEQHGYVLFQAFDVLAFDGEDVTQKSYAQRYELLKELLHGHTGNIKRLGLHIGSDKRKLYDDVIAEGGEGIILKNIHAPYYQGERHKAWVKVKRQKSYDVVFLGVELAEEFTVKKGDEEATRSRIAGKAGAIRFGQWVEKKKVEIPPDSLFTNALVYQGQDIKDLDTAYQLVELGTVSGFDDATRDDITQNAEKYVGRVFEVIAQEQFKTGHLRHPRFIKWRDDKRSAECVLRTDEG